VKHVLKFARHLTGQDSDKVTLFLTPCGETLGEADTLRRSLETCGSL
jgi:hypothetical protein